jgi:pyruvate dehydrogenase (quinone)
VLVLNNRDLNFVTWEQHGKGDPKNEVSQALPGFAYAEYAHMLGLEGIRIDYPGQIASALDAAILAAATAHNAHTGRKVLCCDRQWRP